MAKQLFGLTDFEAGYDYLQIPQGRIDLGYYHAIQISFPKITIDWYSVRQASSEQIIEKIDQYLG